MCNLNSQPESQMPRRRLDLGISPRFPFGRLVISHHICAASSFSRSLKFSLCIFSVYRPPFRHIGPEYPAQRPQNPPQTFSPTPQILHHSIRHVRRSRRPAERLWQHLQPRGQSRCRHRWKQRTWSPCGQRVSYHSLTLESSASPACLKSPANWTSYLRCTCWL
jgi:hypothetical protein